jgi:hypothetical protein
MSTMGILCLLVMIPHRRVAFKACLRYINMKRRLDHVSHLESTVMGILLVGNSRIRLLSFLYKILHFRHPFYLFSVSFCLIGAH